jgi:radical SAM superfamily enzyme YgiQ (UPF0313 family)
VEQVLTEVHAIRKVGGDSIFFTDDNFVGNIKYARTLLTELARLRRSGEFAPLYLTQATVNLAEQTDLLDLMSQAGFTRLFIGLETPRQLSLSECGKKQNTHGDLVERVGKIQQAGIMIWAGMIVGFDHDDVSIFEEQAKFLDDAGVAVAMVGMLNAPPKTPLFTRLMKEGRIDANADWADNTSWTNIIPKRMTRSQLFGGYADLLTELYSQENFARRVLRNISRMGKPAEAQKAQARIPSFSELHALWRAISIFSFSKDPVRRRHFLPNLFRILQSSPERVVEGCIHLGMWRHYETWMPHLVDRLRAAEGRERVREREADYFALQPAANHNGEHLSDVVPLSSLPVLAS